MSDPTEKAAKKNTRGLFTRDDGAEIAINPGCVTHVCPAKPNTKGEPMVSVHFLNNQSVTVEGDAADFTF